MTDTNSRYRIKPWIGYGGGKYYRLQKKFLFIWITIYELASDEKSAKEYIDHMNSGKIL